MLSTLYMDIFQSNKILNVRYAALNNLTFSSLKKEREIMFDTFEEASDLIVQCGTCGKDRTFYVKQVGNKYDLIRCDWEYCLDHCKCGIPELTNNFDHNDIVSSVSMYI